MQNFDYNQFWDSAFNTIGVIGAAALDDPTATAPAAAPEPEKIPDTSGQPAPSKIPAMVKTWAPGVLLLIGTVAAVSYIWKKL